MADSFGTGGGAPAGGGLNLKRFVATPAFLVVVLAIGLLLAYVWFSGRRQAAAAAQEGVVANPLAGPAEGPQVLGTLDTTGLQQQLGNILQAISAGNAAADNKPKAGTAHATVVGDRYGPGGILSAGLRSGPSSGTSEVGRLNSGVDVQLKSSTPITFEGQSWYQLTDNSFIWAPDLGAISPN